MALRCQDTTVDSTIRVLVVDDDPDLAEVASIFLERNPEIEAVTETDPEAGLERFDPEVFDIVVTDYHMPKVDGITLSRRVREAGNVPCILFTSADDPEVMTGAREADIGIVPKRGGPEQFDRLAEQIRRRVLATPT